MLLNYKWAEQEEEHQLMKCWRKRMHIGLLKYKRILQRNFGWKNEIAWLEDAVRIYQHVAVGQCHRYVHWGRGGHETRAPTRKEGERENILCEGNDKICADSFLARGLEHWNSSVWVSGRGRSLHSRADFPRPLLGKHHTPLQPTDNVVSDRWCTNASTCDTNAPRSGKEELLVE